MVTVKLVITGKVQGVFYRASAKKAADANNVTGWVKNTDDGNVEITATGSSPGIDKFISWCREGPPRAVVTDVVVTKIAEEKFDGFEVERD